jgi:hypothetical protein
MPRISQFHGVDIYMYYNDHLPPHFHAMHGDDEALFEINPPSVYRGALRKNALRRVETWAALHIAELEDNWQRARNGNILLPIPPLP